MKRYVIDCSSLVTLAQYFLPFDGSKILCNKVEQLFIGKKIILLKAIHREANHVQKGIVCEKMPWIKDWKAESNIDDITKKLHNKIDDHWAVKSQKNKLEPSQYEELKKKMIEGADFQLVFYALQDKRSHSYSGTIVVTEESRSTNDGKLFKKIPLICKHEKIECINIAKMLQGLGLKIQFEWADNSKLKQSS